LTYNILWYRFKNRVLSLITLFRAAWSCDGPVKVAHDGEQGIRVFDQGNDFDCVITGIRMPRMSGNAVARYIRNSLRPHTPVVAITGASEDAIDKEFFNSYLIKPFRLKSLIDLIGSLNKSH